jgi:hypothetical protein
MQLGSARLGYVDASTSAGPSVRTVTESLTFNDSVTRAAYARARTTADGLAFSDSAAGRRRHLPGRSPSR